MAFLTHKRCPKTTKWSIIIYFGQKDFGWAIMAFMLVGPMPAPATDYPTNNTIAPVEVVLSLTPANP